MKKKAAKAAVKKSVKVKAEPTPVQEALQVTWLLKGKLKSAQIAYLKIGALLVHVRDDKLFSELKHPSIEEYAQKRLNLGRASLYRYLQVYDWVSKSHPEWLKDKPKGFIPYFSDASDLMWIEETLATGKVTKAAKVELEALRAMALEGALKDDEVDKWKKKGGRAADGLKSFLSKVRILRNRGSTLKNMPPDAIKLMDELINVIDAVVDAQPK